MPRDSVLGVTAVRSLHFVKGSDSVARLELGHVGPDLVDNAGDVIALIATRAPPVRELPVLRVGATDDDLDEHLVLVWFGDRCVNDLDRGT